MTLLSFFFSCSALVILIETTQEKTQHVEWLAEAKSMTMVQYNYKDSMEGNYHQKQVSRSG
jgi:hypothetical protein